MKGFWHKHKRHIKIALICAGFFFMLGFFKRYHVPQLKRWLLVEIEEASRKQSPVALRAQSVDLHLIPLGATFYDVTLLPQGDIKNILTPTNVQKVKVSLSTWGLLKGELILGEVRITGTKVSLNLPDNSKPAAGGASAGASGGTASALKGKKFSLQDIYALPIEKIRLEDFKLAAYAPASGFSGAVVIADMILENKYNSLRLGLLLQDLLIRKSGVTSIFTADVETHVLVDDEGLYFSKVKIERGDSKLNASGSLIGDLIKQKFKGLSVKFDGSVDLTELRAVAADLANTQLPLMSGRISFDADVVHDLQGQDDTRSSFNLGAKGFNIEGYDVGDVHLTGKTKDKVLQVQQAEARNAFGSIKIDGAQLNLGNDFAFSANVSSENLVIKELFKAIKLPGVPVYATAKARLPCQGQVKPAFKLTCNGNISGKDFLVETGGSSKTKIVAFPDLGIDGSVTIDTKAVSYKTQLRIGKSKGDSDGVISYNDGFKINYASPALDFSDISYLVNLKPEGVVKLAGQTAGNSDTATIDMNAAGDGLWLSDFFLGRAQWGMRYRKGQIFFDKMQGQIKNSTYKADLMVDVNTDQITLDGALPFIDVEDLLSVFQRKVTLPIGVTGTGAGTLQASGPLDFSHLSYKLNSTFYRGSIASESYDQLRFNVTSHEGNVETDDVSLTKGRSRIVMKGKVIPTGAMNLTVSGRQFQIEQSENLARLKVRLTGNLDFDTKLNGFILQPIVVLDGRITNALLGEVPAGDSSFKLNISPQEFAGSGDFLNDSLSAKFSRPYSTQGETTLNVGFRQWNFAQTFSIFSDSQRGGGFQTSVTGLLNLKFPNVNPASYSGDFKVEEFFIRNANAELASQQPMSLIAQNGHLTAKNFEMTGEGTYVRILTNSTDAGKNKVGIEGRLDLSLMALFLPFFEDIRGRLGFSLGLEGSILKPEFTGSAYVDNAFIKIKNFPHPFEQMQGDAIFRNEKIIINSARGKLAGGILTANGQVIATDVGNVNVDVRGHLEDGRMAVPEGIQTRGSGDFYVRGNWFPYTIGAVYNVASGQIDRKANVANADTPEIKPSRYLPKFLSSQRVSPINLNLEVNMTRQLPVKMKIANVEISCEVNGQIKVVGPPEQVKLTGKVYVIRGGKITLRNNIFEIRNGTLEYLDSDPENPTLSVQADAKVTAQLRNNETRDYDIDLRVQGQAKNPKIVVTSEPPLNENELISLLTLGFINETSKDNTEVTAGDQITNTSYQLGSAFINEQLGLNKVLESRLGVRLDINSSYDTTDKAEKHKFTFRKQWTPKFGMSASREIGKTTTNNVSAEYKLNKNVSTILQWEGTDETSQDTSKSAGTNIFGWDVEYKVDFK